MDNVRREFCPEADSAQKKALGSIYLSINSNNLKKGLVQSSDQCKDVASWSLSYNFPLPSNLYKSMSSDGYIIYKNTSI